MQNYHIDPHKFHDKFETKQKELREKIIKARKILDKVKISDDQLENIAKLSIKLKIDSHRADITINLTAKTIASFHGRTDVLDEDIKIAAKLALAHRLRKLPFEEQSIDEEDIEKLFEEQDKQETQNLDKYEDENLNDKEILNLI